MNKVELLPNQDSEVGYTPCRSVIEINMPFYFYFQFIYYKQTS